MRRGVLLVVVAVLGFAWHGSAESEQANSIQQAILGTWKLVSYVREEVPSGAKSDVMGVHPTGYINYGRDGRMMVMIVGGERKKPAGAVATPEEAQALLTSMLAYAGTYTIDTQTKTVVHHIDISWDQSRTETDQVRSYKLEGKRIALTTEPSADPATGKQTVRTLVWEKLE
jgi:Lipocalin-like domain